MKNTNKEVKDETRGIKAWVKRNKVKIVTATTVVGGLVLLQLTRKEGEQEGIQIGYDEGLVDGVAAGIEDVAVDYVQQN